MKRVEHEGIYTCFTLNLQFSFTLKVENFLLHSFYHSILILSRYLIKLFLFFFVILGTLVYVQQHNYMNNNFTKNEKKKKEDGIFCTELLIN